MSRYRVGRHGRRPTGWQWLIVLAEALPAGFLFGIARMLPVDAASAVGGWLFRRLGPVLGGQHRRVLRNIGIAFPDLPDARRRAIAVGFWENLGRTLFEYPHLQTLRRRGRFELCGVDVFEQVNRHPGPVLGFTGHFANWEANAAVVDGLTRPLGLVYRPPNNPLIDRALFAMRARFGVRQFSKGRTGGRPLVGALKDGVVVGMLVDQRLTNGLDLTFLGAPARTAPALARLARSHAALLVPVRVERLHGAHFRVTACPAWTVRWTADADADVERVMRRVNETLADWVRDRPEQWLWLHDRFKIKPRRRDRPAAPGTIPPPVPHEP